MPFLTRIMMTLTSLALAIGLAGLAYAQRAPLSAVLTNTASLTFGTGADVQTVKSNTTTLNVKSRTRPTIHLMKMAGGADGVVLDASGAQCQANGQSFAVPPIADDQKFDPGHVKLRSAETYHAGEPVFIDVTDPDANLDPSSRDTIDLTISTNSTDQEHLRLTETGTNTGRFVGYIATNDQAPPIPGDCQLSAPRDERLSVSITDPSDPSDTVTDWALIDPYGYVFDSVTGEPLSGARITLIDDATGQPAHVVGDDGVSAYPSSVISGATVTDASGSVYEFDPGAYRFPLAPSGRYHLKIEPPSGYAAPSLVADADMAGLTTPEGGAFTLSPASRGAAFDLVDVNPLQVDVPMDGGGVRALSAKIKGLSLDKVASVSTGSFGDFIQYRLTTRSLAGPITKVMIKDILPPGLRYVAGSAKRDGVALADPVIGSDSRTLTFTLGALTAGGSGVLTYVVAIGADTPVGDAVNRATAQSSSGATSNPAEARVRVTAPLMTDAATVIGRVTESACGPRDKPGPGVAGVRVLMEDGTFVASDRDGLFHFEGVRPGVHVVQLDVDSLPMGYAPVACGRDTRLAGRAFSQFVDIKGGALWRVEFRLKRTAGAAIAVRAADVPEDEDAAIDWFADQAPGVGWVFPGEGHNPPVPAIRVAIKHLPGQHVDLRLNGQPVDPLSRDGVETRADGAMAISLWRGVPLAEGANTLSAQVTDKQGHVVAKLERVVSYANTPAHAVLVPEMSRLSADGMSNPVVAVRFTDRFGHPVRSGAMGTFEISAPYAPAQDAAAQQNRQLSGQDSLAPTWRVQGGDGVAMIALAPVTQAGPAVLKIVLPGARAERPTEIRAWLKADREKWVVVGFGAGTLGFNTLSRHAAPLSRTDARRSFADGQLAFYAKGRVKGAWLLTMAYDNQKPADRDRGLFSAIDPARYYTVYGDASGQAYDAASQRKLYLRLERPEFYALFGDYRTGFDATELGRYDRALNGLKFERQGRTFSIAGFAAKTDQTHIRDEILGSGLSGPYRLSRHDLVPNTETVTVETRDRARPERILASRSLTRHIDYDIDAAAGEISFREPVLSHDLDGDPNVIVVGYEVIAGSAKSLEAGLRATKTLAGGKATAGVTYLHGDAGRVPGAADLVSADLVVRPRTDTQVKLEAAVSQTAASGAQSAYLAEVDHHSETLDVLAYYRQEDAAFGLGQQNLAELGARKMGVDGKIRLTPTLNLALSGYHETYMVSGADRDVADARLDYRRGALNLSAGLKVVQDQTTSQTSGNSNLLTLGASHDFLDRRLQVTVATDIPLGGKAESVDFPARQRLGVAYEIREGVRLLASHEIFDGATYRSATTRGGVEITPWKGARLTSALSQQELSAFGPRTYAQMGLSQSVKLGEGWTVDGSVDASHTLSGATPPANALNPVNSLGPTGVTVIAEDFTAVSLGAAFRADTWSWNGRAEIRKGDRADTWNVRANYVRSLKAGVTAAASLRTYETTTPEGAAAGGTEITGALAWRPIDSRWSVLDKLEYRTETARGTAKGQPLDGYGVLALSDGASARVINNLAINFDSQAGDHAKGAIQASVYHGAKYVRGVFDGDRETGFVQVVGADARYDLSSRVDIGVNLAIRHAAQGGQTALTFGPSVGISPADNAWISVGYNLVGFHDRDFEDTNYTRQGPYITARFKFDQLSLAPLGHMIERRIK